MSIAIRIYSNEGGRQTITTIARNSAEAADALGIAPAQAKLFFMSTEKDKTFEVLEHLLDLCRRQFHEANPGRTPAYYYEMGIRTPEEADREMRQYQQEQNGGDSSSTGTEGKKSE